MDFTLLEEECNTIEARENLGEVYYAKDRLLFKTITSNRLTRA